NPRGAHRETAPVPRVLLMRVAALELEEHPEATSVDCVAAGLAGEPGERTVGDQRDRLVEPRAGAIRTGELHRQACQPGQRLLPRPWDNSATDVDRACRRVDPLATSPPPPPPPAAAGGAPAPHTG